MPPSARWRRDPWSGARTAARAGRPWAARCLPAPSGTSLTPGGPRDGGPRDDVDDDREDEQEHAEPDQRGAEHAGRLAELVGDDGGHVVAGCEEVRGDRGGRTDHERGRDRLADG